jgi:hypothetical protein
MVNISIALVFVHAELQANIKTQLHFKCLPEAKTGLQMWELITILMNLLGLRR